MRKLIDLDVKFGDLRLERIKIGQKLLTLRLGLFFLGDFVVQEVDKIRFLFLKFLIFITRYFQSLDGVLKIFGETLMLVVIVLDRLIKFHILFAYDIEMVLKGVLLISEILDFVFGLFKTTV